MMNVCFQCGMYRADKEIDPSGPFAICPECGYRHPFLRLPLLIVSGASGTGKTAICHNLLGQATGAVLLDSDILWRPEFNTPEKQYRDFFETWLRVCKNISQSGHPVVLFGAGMGVPANLESCIERRYFSEIHYLALVCSNEILAKRLRQRPAWRRTHDLAFIREQKRFNRWFRAFNGPPVIQLLDTTDVPVERTAQVVHDWIKEKTNTRSIEDQ